MINSIVSKKSLGLSGEIKIPGDKSISHRALIIGSSVNGTIKIYNILESDDVLATANALKKLGIIINKISSSEWEIKGNGIGTLEGNNSFLDMGNSGTGVRLLMGLVAGSDVEVTFSGDYSLNNRPMARVIEPLLKTGAIIKHNNNTLPIKIKGSKIPLPISYNSPVSSAQVKSAILLAGMSSLGKTKFTEPSESRDHSERMLKYLGAEINTNRLKDGSCEIILNGMPILKPLDINIPSDPSSAAFPIVAALITPNSEILIKNICVNELRIGLLYTLIEMGAKINISNKREINGEIIADIIAKSSILNAITVPKSRAPSMIDEYPILAIAASQAKGTTIMEGVEELRYKETDRISAIVEGLCVLGIEANETKDSISITGISENESIQGGIELDSRLDHRIAMSFLCLGLVTKRPIILNNTETINSSFPSFFNQMNQIGANLEYMTTTNNSSND